MLKNLIWGAGIGLSFGIAFFVIACAVLLLGASPKRMDGSELELLDLLLLYLCGGIGVGLILGLLRPLARSRAAAIGIGILCAFVVSSAAGLLLLGQFARWQFSDWIGLAIWSLIFGIYAGNSFWKKPLPE